MQKILKQNKPLLLEAYGEDQTQQILALAQEEYDSLCREHPDQVKAVKQHTFAKIYPNVALYRALQRCGVPQPEALDFMDHSCCALAEPQAASMRAMMKIPGAYKLMPNIFTWVAKHQFGEAAGFRAKFYNLGSARSKFDMTHCLYCDVCRDCGCPELTVCFCHTDDVTDGNMHPKLLWNRTQTMGEGAEFCDFDLLIVPKK